MKTASFLSGYLLRIMLAFGLVVAAALVGVGVAGMVAYHQIGGSVTPSHPASRPVAVPTADESVVPKTVALSSIETWEGQAIMMDVSASLAANRFIAAASSDRSQLAYADYQPDARVGSANTGDVPPSLVPSSPERTSAVVSTRPVLSDPGSRYIINPDTGLIVGIDGRAGAQAEAAQQRAAQPGEAGAPTLRGGQEVRAALPTDAPVVSDLPPPKPGMFPAIRRAEPVDPLAADADAAPTARRFDAEEELTDDRPVFRAQPVTISQSVRTQRRVFALP